MRGLSPSRRTQADCDLQGNLYFTDLTGRRVWCEGLSVAGLVFHPAGWLAGCGAAGLFRIVPASGQTTFLACGSLPAAGVTVLSPSVGRMEFLRLPKDEVTNSCYGGPDLRLRVPPSHCRKPALGADHIVDLLPERGGVGVEHFAAEERVTIDGVVERQHAVQVIDLVLEELRFGPRQTLPLLDPPFRVRKTDGDGRMSADAHQEPGKGHAVIPQGECLRAPGKNLRIDHEERSAAKIHCDQPAADPDLGCRDCATEAMTTAKRGERLCQSAGVVAERRIADVLDGLRDQPELRIAEKQHIRNLNRHPESLRLAGVEGKEGREPGLRTERIPAFKNRRPQDRGGRFPPRHQGSME
jgi:hypothetical protein